MSEEENVDDDIDDPDYVLTGKDHDSKDNQTYNDIATNNRRTTMNKLSRLNRNNESFGAAFRLNRTVSKNLMSYI